MCPALWCKIGLGDWPLPSSLPSIFLDALSAQGRAPISLSVHRNLGASEAELSSKKGSPLSLGASRQRWAWRKLFLLSMDMRMGEQTLAWEMGLCMQLHRPPGIFPGSKKSCPRGRPGLEGPKKPWPRALWKPEQSPESNGTMPFLLGCAGGFGFFFLYTKRLVPSLKKGPFKNDAKLTLLELQRVCWEARSCNNIIERRIDIFPILKGSFVAILMLV